MNTLILSLLISLAPLASGDRVCFLGDSITAGGFYTAQWEASEQARHPERSIDLFPIGGYNAYKAGAQPNVKIPNVLEHGCDVVIVEFGMNDGAYKAYVPSLGTAYAAGLRMNIDTIRALSEPDPRIILLSPPPIEPANYGTRNGCDPYCYLSTLSALSAVGASVAAEKGVEFADILNPILAGYDALGAGPVRATTDGVHPDHTGGLLYATALEAIFGESGSVGAISVNTASASIVCTRCSAALTMNTSTDVRFNRLDEAQPLIIPDAGVKMPTEILARSIYAADPVLRARNAYMLTVSGLQAGSWRLSLDGIDGPTFSHSQLSSGVDLGDLAVNFQLVPLANQQLAALVRMGSVASQPAGIWDRRADIMHLRDNFYDPQMCPRMTIAECDAMDSGLSAFRVSVFGGVLENWRNAYHAASQPATHAWRLRRL